MLIFNNQAAGDSCEIFQQIMFEQIFKCHKKQYNTDFEQIPFQSSIFFSLTDGLKIESAHYQKLTNYR